jgi:protein-tyrosine phosphatase
MSTILIVGAADTGRAPMAAALLRRLLGARGYGWVVESAGVLGHDGAEAETEARDTMVHLGLDIADHRARSIDADCVAQAALLVVVDSGTARVVRARFPDTATRAYILGELAGRSRDIPDPFRMQIGAWMTYAREIDAMLAAALPRIVELMPVSTSSQTAPDAAQPVLQTPAEALPAERVEAVARIGQLLALAAQMPGVVDWAAARARIETDLAAAGVAAAPGDLAAAYVGLLRAALNLLPATPSAGQLMALGRAAGRLSEPIGQADLNELSGQLATLATLT